MKKNYVSNSSESVRMFKSSFMESLSKVHFSVPLFIYIPVIGYISYLAFAADISVGKYVLFFFGGLLVWTATEYLLHRFIFHFHPTSTFGKRIHFIFHGVHHDYPRDAKRLVMPPSASIPLALLFYFIFSLIIPGAPGLYAFFSGFLIGYLTYDMLHYAMHHANFKNPILKRIKQHHMLHHYSDDTKGFGVSSSIWDIIFHSGFADKK